MTDFPRRFRIANLIGAEIDDRDFYAVLYLAFAGRADSLASFDTPPNLPPRVSIRRI